MASEKILNEKKALVAELSEKIQGSVSGVIVTYQGITVADDTALRVALRKAGVEYKVYKNSITKRACENTGYGELAEHFTGMTAIAISSEDAVAPAKVLKEYADKIETFEIKGGFVDGAVIDAEGVKALAAIPAKPVLVAKLMGGMMSPVTKLAVCLQAIIDKQSEGEQAEAPAAE